MPRFLRTRFVLPMSDELGRATRLEDGYLLWSGGRLAEVDRYTPEAGQRLLDVYGESLEVVGAASPRATSPADLVQLDAVALPGFVKAHGHDHEPPIIGLVKDVPLTRWLDGVVNPFTGFMVAHGEALTARLGRSPQAVAYLKARLDDLYYGITTSMVHHCNYSKYFADDLAAAALTAGTRMIIAVGSQDRHYYEAILDTPADAIARLDGYHERHAGSPRVTIVPGPDQLFSNGPEMLQAQKAWAREHGTLFHCHSSEERNTTAWFRETYGQTPVEYAHGLGILDEHTVLAHQVHCTERDLDLLAETGTRIAHNPLANTILGSGMPPLPAMLSRGIPIAISTDGSGSADNQNILAAARLATQYQKAFHADAALLPAQQVLEMITCEPARILGLDSGVLAPGRPADVTVVALDRPNMTPTRVSNLVENLIWASDGSEVRLVVADGEVVRDGDAFPTLDSAGILRQVTALSEAFDAYLAEAPAIRGTGANR